MPTPLQATDTESTITMEAVDNTKLITRGTVMDRIQTTTMEFPRSPHEEYEFIRVFVKVALLINQVMGPNMKPDDSAEAPANMLFNVIIRREFHTEDKLTSLKSGFRSFLGWFPNVVKIASQITGDRMAILPVDSPYAFRLFMATAFRSTAGTRFCVTDKGCFGLVPECTEVDDRVVLFKGSRVRFVLRGSGEKDGSYKLVGNGYFYGMVDDRGRLSMLRELQDIVLV